MSNYVIFTDSACDIKPELLREWGVCYRALTFYFNDDNREYSNDDMPVGEFYEKMRQGGVAKTSAVNVDAFAESILPEMAYHSASAQADIRAGDVRLLMGEFRLSSGESAGVSVGVSARIGGNDQLDGALRPLGQGEGARQNEGQSENQGKQFLH